MKIETINKSNKKYIIIGIILFCILGSVIVLKTTRAKYKTTQSINIVNGTINYKPYDFKVLAMYKQKEGSTCTEDSCYEEITGRMPTSGYVINESKSYCTLDGTNKDTEAKLKTIEGHHVIENLAKNEKCKLYFNKVIALSDIIARLSAKETEPDYTQAATTDEGVYKIFDGMYRGYSYFWRGAATTNHVIFAEKCWRIIRINGNGSFRLIYNGAIQGTNACHDNGKWDGSVAVTKQKYNSSYDRSEYVGYTYESENQRPTSTTTESPSNLKTQTESWYAANITQKGYNEKVESGKFCNDRNTVLGSSWSSKPSSTFYYAGYDRRNGSPTLVCPDDDVYTLKVGAITMDEVLMAGGKYGTANSTYYLYNGQYYWTMSPYRTFSNDPIYEAGVFDVYNDGQLLWAGVQDANINVRPVINLKSTTVFATGGQGTTSKPYVVA